MLNNVKQDTLCYVRCSYPVDDVRIGAMQEEIIHKTCSFRHEVCVVESTASKLSGEDKYAQLLYENELMEAQHV